MIWHRPGLCLAIGALVLSVLPGCRPAAERQWEIVVENQAERPCAFTVEIGAGERASVVDVPRGKRRILLSGFASTVIHSVKVVRDNDEQSLKPEVEIRAGKRYVILVEADGKVTTVLSEN